MTVRIAAAAVLAAALLVPSFALAGGKARNRVERAQNNAELRDDRRETRDDARDLARLDAAVDDWHAARKSGDGKAERRADERIEAWIRAELREDRGEVKEAKQEVRRSEAEVRDSRRERNRSAARARPKATADDQRDLRDDKRDARDDRGDLRAEKAELRREIAIAKELQSMQPRFDAGKAGAKLYAQKSSLLRELQRGARKELARDVQETREDKREQKEDRRERREDRRRR